ncbi:MAG: M56 family metallopeptidase [Colwellia sp.]|nr:M56 family metallopeptidase [Colwellia sp.]
MTSWLLSQILPVSLLVIMLIMSHKFVLKRLGAIGQYSLWSLLPFTLLLSFVEFPSVKAIANSQISHYVVNGQKQIQGLVGSDWLLWAWFAGAVIFTLVIFSLGYKASTDKSLEKIDKNSNHFSTQLSLPKSLSLFSSEEITSPLICGFINPRLVVPVDFFDKYSEQEQRLIIAHEVCHFLRKDLYANFFAVSLLILFWFNPVIWLGYFRFRKDQELACDSQVLSNKSKSSKLIYSRALLKCAQSGGQLSFAQLQYGDRQTMTERILQIKTMRPVSKLMTLTAISLGMLASISLSYAGSEGSAHDHKAEQKTEHHGPHPVMRIEPKYPIDAAKNRITGFVQLAFDVSSSGDVNNISIIESSPIGVFDNVATKALSQWKYKASINGSKQSTVQLDFVMDEPKKNIEHIKVTP